MTTLLFILCLLSFVTIVASWIFALLATYGTNWHFNNVPDGLIDIANIDGKINTLDNDILGMYRSEYSFVSFEWWGAVVYKKLICFEKSNYIVLPRGFFAYNSLKKIYNEKLAALKK